MFAQTIADVPSVYTNIRIEQGKYFYIHEDGRKSELLEPAPRYTVEAFRQITATGDGLKFDFRVDEGATEQLSGTLYYGFLNPDARFQQPVFFKKNSKIEDGIATLKIGELLTGKYDMVNWEETGYGELGYRVVDDKGNMLYDGKVTFGYDQLEDFFYLPNSIVEGPFLAQLGPDSIVVRYSTLKPSRDAILARVASDTSLLIRAQDAKPTTLHELTLSGLSPDTEHILSFEIGDAKTGNPRRTHLQTYRFKTAPQIGSRTPFTFGFCSDSRTGQGGGERDLFGTNSYIMKKNAALAARENCRFVQFTGDLINGYDTRPEEHRLQIVNWKRTVEPFSFAAPFIVGMGNHEALVYEAGSYGDKDFVSVNKWPFATKSAEAMFAQEFTNPTNGPISEDGSALDPNPNTTDFPPYAENCFHYTYDNVAMVVLNSNYLYTPSLRYNPRTGGNLHAYIMDNQMAWLKATLEQLEQDQNIDHVIVTQHTPAFPNGGHSKDDMWYSGENDFRPIIAGKRAEQGIIERRDAYLDLLVNQSTKVRAILAGDEHNYSRLRIHDGMERYPKDYPHEKVQLSREIWQLTNGAAGAPYYAQEDLPWSEDVSIFSTQNCLLLFDVDGRKISVRAKNPDTLEDIEEFELGME
ncbi:MAG: metallophosphoesterase family protein [Bacteroidota bacterium]